MFSTWRLLPDLQTGIVHVPSDNAHAALLELLNRIATTPVGVSPYYDDLGETPQALWYARAATKARGSRDSLVTVFEDSVLAIAAVSAPEVTKKLADSVLSGFDELTPDERAVVYDTFRAWVNCGGSVAKTAKQLYCHPNTVRYRLHRIEERTGRSLSEPEQLAELCLAFSIHWHTW